MPDVAFPATYDSFALPLIALAIALFLSEPNAAIGPIVAIWAKCHKVFVPDIMLVGWIAWSPVSPGNSNVVDAEATELACSSAPLAMSTGKASDKH